MIFWFFVSSVQTEKLSELDSILGKGSANRTDAFVVTGNWSNMREFGVPSAAQARCIDSTH